MKDEPALYSGIQAFFDTTLVDTRYLYIDVWSFVHLTSGVVLGLVLARWLRPVVALAWAVGLILGYEVAELALNDILFVPEMPVDTIWDAIVGFTGAFVALRVTTTRARRKQKLDESMYL
jgi:hypothetical protein